MICGLLLVVLAAHGGHRAPRPSYDAEIAAAVEDVRRVYPVPPALVKAVIRQESAFNPRAVSKVGARGLMQLMPLTAETVGVSADELFLPGPNILAGTRLLAGLLRYYQGDLISVLTAYNSGPKKPMGAIPANGETPAYVLGVIRYYYAYDTAQR
jgi:soluble lytic murein transglycosylase-like protein